MLMKPATTYCSGIRKLCPTGSFLTPFILAFFLIGSNIINVLNAQCALACRGKGNISLGYNCEAKVEPSVLLTDGLDCPDARYRVDVMDYNMKLIPTSPIITEDYVRMTVTVMIYDSTSRNSCWGKLYVEDKFAPVIRCKNDTLYCNDTLIHTPPYFIDYCDPYPTIQLVDEGIIPYPCDPNFLKLVLRSWVATDNYGNRSPVCRDTIWVKRIPIDSVKYPKDFVHFTNCHLECNGVWPLDANGHPHPDTTHVPTIDGLPLWPTNNQYCNLGTTYEDVVVIDNPCKKKIIRMWRVVEWWCGSAVVRSHPQIIEIIDSRPPHLHCPYNITVSTSSGYNDCSARFLLPPAIVSDDCQDSIRVVVRYDGNTLLTTNGGYAKLPEGVHELTYYAYDYCDNFDTCTMTVTVEDKTAPIVVCDQGIIVTLTRDDEVHVYAEVFNESSYDECHIDSFLVRRMDGGAPCGFKDNFFQPFVRFCCEDAGKKVMVQLRVKDKAGNYNECMVEVEIQDKTPPIIHCPHDYSIPCSKHIDTVDLQRFGKPDYYDNCIVHMHEYVDTNLNQCGIGHLGRNFVIEDNMGRRDTCRQRIFVYPIDSLDEYDIIWPRDTVIYSCGANLEPKNLPKGYNYPDFLSVDCSLPGSSFEDHVFNYIQDSSLCFKLLRKWKVIDWCQQHYNENGDLVFNSWHHEQIIKVSNKNPPKIKDDCDTVNVCISNNNCIRERVRLTHEASDDCTPDALLRSSFKLDLFNNSLIDSTYTVLGNSVTFDGELPLGEHRFIWVFEDQCGNREVCYQIVRIVNCKVPTAYCLTGIAINLNGVDLNGDGKLEGVIQVWASDLDRGSYQFCGNPITLSFSRDSSDKYRVYNCDSLGQRNVEIWVTDRVTGLQDYCRTSIIVQDNNKICPQTLTRGNIAGTIMTPFNDPIQEVSLTVEGVSTVIDAEFNGNYTFLDLYIGSNYLVKIKKDKQYLQGVSTYDILQIQNHILGRKDLQSPWRKLAADVNNDHNITASDISTLRKLILGVDYKFKNSLSWRFVSATYQFPDPYNPWSQPIPDVYSIQQLPGNMMYLDFVGIKVGDVSQTVWDSAKTAVVRTKETVEFYSSTTQDDHMVAIKSMNDLDIQGMQFTLHLDTKIHELADIKPGILSIRPSNLGYTYLNDGIILVSWTADQPIHVNKDQVLFYIELQQPTAQKALESIYISSEVLNAEMYNAEQEEVNVRWSEHSNPLQKEDVVIGTPIPNPFFDMTMIPIEVKKAMTYTYRIFDLNGSLIYTNTELANPGKQYIKIKRQYLNQAGVYTLRVEASGFNKSYKLVMMNQ